MQIPDTFTAKISRVFGDEGRAWLERLPQILAACRQRWGLTDIRVAPGLSYNLICFAQSPTHGAVALKVGVPHPELFSEMKALKLYAGRPICACYDADEELGALLLERVAPGNDLRTVTSASERFRIAAELFVTLPVPAVEGFPAYADWVRRAFARARREGRAGADLLSLVEVAERYFSQIDTPDRPQVLLHGDLHHMNILQDGESWKAIDPKGAVGVACLEPARFMQNEFDMGDPADRLERLDQMCSVFAERLGEPKRVMAMCVFVDQVLGTVWGVEENVAPSELAAAVQRCQELLNYC